MIYEKLSDQLQTLSDFMLPIVYKNGDQLVVLYQVVHNSLF